MEVAEENCGLGAGDDQDDEHEEEEAEQVVELVLPDGGEDEEELDEHGAERQDACHQHAEHRVQVPHLLRNLPPEKRCNIIQCYHQRNYAICSGTCHQKKRCNIIQYYHQRNYAILYDTTTREIMQ